MMVIACYSSVSGTGALCLSSNAAQTSPQRSSNVSPGAFLEFQALFGEAPAKPTRSLRGPISCHHPLASAFEAQTSPSFLPPAET